MAGRDQNQDIGPTDQTNPGGAGESRLVRLINNKDVHGGPGRRSPEQQLLIQDVLLII